jgi:signal transduction histidine kinase
MSSLGRIASGMAHEIRNPLTGITSYLYTLEQLCDLQTLLPKDFELMKQIVSQLKLASHKVDAVIKRVLDFSRPTPPQMLRIDVNRCIENVLNLAAVNMRKAGVRVSTELSEKLPACYGDAALIEQVFMNLIQNASRAVQSIQREKIVVVSSGSKGNQIIVAVSDSGSGVPGDSKEKIFDPFFTTSSEGSGIGLSIAQRIVTDHSGSLSVHDSELGGARFVVVLPIDKRNLT